MKNVLKRFKEGEFIIVFDEHREHEADFFLLAEYITPKAVNFLLKNACGMICVACEKKILDRLQIPLMTTKNTSPHQTNFCIPVDGGEGISTGVSASDRAKVIKLLTNNTSKSSDFFRPGHTHPLRAESDFSKRFGHTEAAVFLAQKCGEIPAVVICEILNKEGEKASAEEVRKISIEGDFALITLEEIRNLSQNIES